jgi:type II secretory pathway pseudopilin PulG
MKNSLLKSGFSFIEVSLLLVVISSLAVITLTKYTAGQENKAQETASEDLARIKSAIENYVSKNKYYPCPADPTLPKSDDNFGLGIRDGFGNCDLNLNITMASFYTKSIGDFSSNPALYSNVIAQKDIIQGTIPCNDLGLKQDCMFDPQGNRYSYAVIPELARAGTDSTIPTACNRYYANTGGGFEVVELKQIKILKKYPDTGVSLEDTYADNENHYGDDGNVGTLPDINDSDGVGTPADFVVVYYGKDGIGAYNNIGNARIEPVAITGGFAGDNAYQEINHDLRNGSGIDEYFFAPDTSFNENVTFGDIVVFGKNDTIRNTYCLDCRDISGSSSEGAITPKVVAVNCENCDVGALLLDPEIASKCP